MKKQLQEKLENLFTNAHVPVLENDLDVYEQVIHDRGVSAGYFNIAVEDISELTIIEQIAYIEGQIHGIENFEKLTEEQKKARNYDEFRISYLKNLGAWYAHGEIQKVDLSSLNEEELKYFNEGTSYIFDGVDIRFGTFEKKPKAKTRQRSINL